MPNPVPSFERLAPPVYDTSAFEDLQAIQAIKSHINGSSARYRKRAEFPARQQEIFGALSEAVLHKIGGATLAIDEDGEVHSRIHVPSTTETRGEIAAVHICKDLARYAGRLVIHPNDEQLATFNEQQRKAYEIANELPPHFELTPRYHNQRMLIQYTQHNGEEYTEHHKEVRYVRGELEDVYPTSSGHFAIEGISLIDMSVPAGCVFRLPITSIDDVRWRKVPEQEIHAPVV